MENIENIESPKNFKITITDKGNEKDIERLAIFKKTILERICGHILDLLFVVNNVEYELTDLSDVYDKKNNKLEIVFGREVIIT